MEQSRVSFSRLIAAKHTMMTKRATFKINNRPYPVPTRCGMLPTRNQELRMPVANSTATTMTPKAEKRTVISAGSAATEPRRRASLIALVEQRQEAADPSTGRHQVHGVARRLKRSRTSPARSSVSGPYQGCQQASRQDHPNCALGLRAPASINIKPLQHQRKQPSNDEARNPIFTETRLCEHGPQGIISDHLGNRLSRYSRADEQQPNRARGDRNAKRAPRHPPKMPTKKRKPGHASAPKRRTVGSATNNRKNRIPASTATDAK